MNADLSAAPDIEAKDKLDRPIVVGSIIVYGHSLNRSAGLRIGKVLAITQVPMHDIWDPGRIKLTVMGVNDDWEATPRLLNRKGTLAYPASRVIVLDRDNVPARYLKVLDKVRA